jgi:hypothetical protein
MCSTFFQKAKLLSLALSYVLLFIITEYPNALLCNDRGGCTGSSSGVYENNDEYK